MGLYLKGRTQVRSVNWSKAWLWDIRFEAGPSGFNNWFPASSIEINEFSIEPFEIIGGNSSFAIPKNTSLFDLKITYIDDIHLHIEEWINHWVNIEILGGGNTATIEESVKLVNIIKYKNNNKIVQGYPKNYWVFPRGALYYKGSSEPTNLTDTLEFVIAGEI